VRARPPRSRVEHTAGCCFGGLPPLLFLSRLQADLSDENARGHLARTVGPEPLGPASPLCGARCAEPGVVSGHPERCERRSPALVRGRVFRCSRHGHVLPRRQDTGRARVRHAWRGLLGLSECLALRAYFGASHENARGRRPRDQGRHAL
jgi:hypothetical protein